jgi:hypothetical protein
LVDGSIALQTRRGLARPDARPDAVLALALLALAVVALVDLGSGGWVLAAMFASWALLPAYVASRFPRLAWVMDAQGIDSWRWLARPVPWRAVTGLRLGQRTYAAGTHMSAVNTTTVFVVVEAPGAVHLRSAAR